MNLRIPRRAGIIAATALVVVASLTSSIGVQAQDRKLAMGVAMMPFDNMGLLDDFTATTGQPPALWALWSAWGAPETREFPTGLVNELLSRGITPDIVWEPSVPSNQLNNHFTYRRIARGDFDKYIRRFAKAAAQIDGRIVLRFAHEPNGTWFPWSYNRFDNTPRRFIAAWRHVWQIFRSVGATNVKFMYSPNEPCGACASIASMYPGDRYVDYIGISSFNWGPPRTWKNMVALYQKSMNAIAKVNPRKPIIIAETASSPVGGDKAAWIANGYPAVYAKWPRIKAIIYFNIDFTDHGHPDWRLTKPDTGPLEAYTDLLTQSRFQATLQ